MAKKAYIGIDGAARRVKKGYVGVETVARRVKKAYIGVGGVARPCWSGGEVTYYGTTAALAGAAEYAVSNNKYAIFMTAGPNVCAYDKNLTQTGGTTTYYHWDGTGARIGEYAVFAGGGTSSNMVQAYDGNLVRTAPTVLSIARRGLAGSSTPTHAIFMGGYNDNGSRTRNEVDAYNENLTRTTSALTTYTAPGTNSGTTVGPYGIFGGGDQTRSGRTTLNCVHAFDGSLTQSTPTGLSVARTKLIGGSQGNHAIFAGGGVLDSNTTYTTVDAYDTSLSRSTITSLTTARKYGKSEVLGDYMLVCGGETSSGAALSSTELYDRDLTHTTITGMSVAKGVVSAATIGDYTLIASMYEDTAATVDVYALT